MPYRYVLLAMALVLMVATCARPGTRGQLDQGVDVAEEGDLFRALIDPAVETINLTSDITLNPDTWTPHNNVPVPVLSRNVTIRAPGKYVFPMLNFNFVKGGFSLAPGVYLNIIGVIVRGDTFSPPDFFLDLLAPSPGGHVVYKGVIRAMVACPTVRVMTSLLAGTPLPPGVMQPQEAAPFRVIVCAANLTDSLSPLQRCWGSGATVSLSTSAGQLNGSKVVGEYQLRWGHSSYFACDKIASESCQLDYGISGCGQREVTGFRAQQESGLPFPPLPSSPPLEPGQVLPLPSSPAIADEPGMEGPPWSPRRYGSGSKPRNRMIIILTTAITGGLVIGVVAAVVLIYCNRHRMAKASVYQASTSDVAPPSSSDHGLQLAASKRPSSMKGGMDSTPASVVFPEGSSSPPRTNSVDSFTLYMDALEAHSVSFSTAKDVTSDHLTGEAHTPRSSNAAAHMALMMGAGRATAPLAALEEHGSGEAGGSTPVGSHQRYGSDVLVDAGMPPNALRPAGMAAGTAVALAGRRGGSKPGAAGMDARGGGAAAVGDPLRAVITERTPAMPGVRLDIDFQREVLLHQGPAATIGAGCFGTVFRGVYEGRQVAVKMINSAWTGGSKVAELASFRQEVQILSRCDHRNIVRLHGASLMPPFVCLVEELMVCSLEEVIHNLDQPLPLPRVLSLARDIATGLAYLHPTILHRDLKPANILLDEAGDAKLVDFGLARLRSSTLVTLHPEAGTCAYMAPECFDDRAKGTLKKCDIYSLGVLLWEMVTRTRPWEGQRHVVIAYTTVQGNRPPMPQDPAVCPPKLCKLIERCWHADPDKRPDAAALVKLLSILLQQLDQATA